MQRLHPDDIKALAREIAGLLADDALLDAGDIAALSGYSQRHVAERLTKQPGWPAPVRAGGGQRKWRRAEVVPLLTPQAGKPGRKRKDAAL